MSETAPGPEARRWIERLGLESHPEGGWFQETWRGPAGPDGRVIGTAIYFLLAGERPQRVVPAGAWQRARSLGAYTLVGTTMAPGIDVDGFELAHEGWEPDGAA